MLTPPQIEVLESELLTTGFNCILQMPTGSGKTWLAELAIENVLKLGGKAIYLTPLRALGAELATRWRDRFNASVGLFTGDYGVPGRPYPIAFQNSSVLIMTPERLDACTRTWRTHWKWIPDIDLIVADELHLLGDSNRGGRLEGALSRFRRINPFVRILGLSATLGNCSQLAAWLDGVEYISTWRPIPLEWRVLRYRKADQKPELLASTVQQNIDKGGKSLAFVHSRRRAEELSNFLQNQGLQTLHHHAGMTQERRRIVEQRYRAGEIDVLVATATLEMGLNLPVRQVVLYDLQNFDGTDFVPLTTNSVWQRAGRAGRPGLDEQGEVVLLAPTWDHQAETYIRGQFEPIYSALAKPSSLAEQMIAEVSSGMSRTAEQLDRTFSHSLAAKQGNLPNVKELLDEMINAEMICQKSDPEGQGKTSLHATRLGRIAVRHFITPATVLQFHQALHKPFEWTFLDLLILISCSSDCQPVLPVDYEELDAIAERLSQEPSTLLEIPIQQLIKELRISDKRLLSGLKMALVLRQWSRKSDIEVVAEDLECYPFEVHQLIESANRLLLALNSILEKPEPDESDRSEFQEAPLLVEKISALAQMISGGLDEFTVTLTLIDGIGPKTALRLHQNGIDDIEALALATPNDVIALGGISAERAQRWITNAEELISTHSAWAFRENTHRPQIVSNGLPAEIDPYRLRRAYDLKVSGGDGGIYHITGGLEPHRVKFQDHQWGCDCVDFQHGHTCKHILAVRLYRKDQTLLRLAQKIIQTGSDNALNLFDLWFSTSTNTIQRRKR